MQGGLSVKKRYPVLLPVFSLLLVLSCIGISQMMNWLDANFPGLEDGPAWLTATEDGPAWIMYGFDEIALPLLAAVFVIEYKLAERTPKSVMHPTRLITSVILLVLMISTFWNELLTLLPTQLWMFGSMGAILHVIAPAYIFLTVALLCKKKGA